MLNLDKYTRVKTHSPVVIIVVFRLHAAKLRRVFSQLGRSHLFKWLSREY